MPEQSVEIQQRIDEIRRASFEGSRKGYDRGQVRRYLEAVADWLDGLGLGDADRGEVRRELAWVGERTSEILTKAEEAAGEMREKGQTESDRVRSEAAEEAERVRTEADAAARKARLEATTNAEETIAAAERRAEAIVEEATRRRQDLQALISDLHLRRDEIVADGVRLADELAELFATVADLPEAEDEGEDESADDEDEADEAGPTRRRFAPEDLDEGDQYDEDGVRVPLADDGPESVAGKADPGETVESRALDPSTADEPDTEEQSASSR
jgi:DivIVA domain-containing protein